jgi:hypothetical protein
MAHTLNTQIHFANKGAVLSFNNRFNIVNKKFFCKPLGGFWVSSYLGPARISAWREWCVSDMPHWIVDVDLYKVVINPDAHIYEIDTQADLVSLHNRYPANYGFGKYLNFEAIARNYDGIHLTEDGQWATRYGSGINLYGWDLESTVLFTKCFEFEPYQYRSIKLSRNKIKRRSIK